MDKHGSPTFYELLKEMSEIHERKSHDYASNENPFGNYIFAGLLAELFKHNPRDMGFISRIGEKIYRLANLEKSGKIPNNESIEDTERDIVTITALWMACRRDSRPVATQTAATQRPDLNSTMINTIENITKLNINELLQLKSYINRYIADLQSHRSAKVDMIERPSQMSKEVQSAGLVRDSPDSPRKYPALQSE